MEVSANFKSQQQQRAFVPTFSAQKKNGFHEWVGKESPLSRKTLNTKDNFYKEQNPVRRAQKKMEGFMKHKL